jgi:exodeoxyribonuclease V beta subunit
MMRPYPKPAILERLGARGHAIIEASAGTGKTFTLEHLLIELLLTNPDVDLEHILVVTFTERATAELKARVRALLGQLLYATRPDGPPVYVEGPRWEIGPDERRRLERALFTFDVAPIYTIHGFCQRVLTEYAFLHRRAFEQEHADFHPLFDAAFTESMRRTLSVNRATRDWLEAWLEVGSVDELRALLARCVVSRAELWPRLNEEAIERGLRRHGETLWATYRRLYRASCTGREQTFLAAQADWIKHRSVARFLMMADAEINGFKHSLRHVHPEEADEEFDSFMEFVGALVRFKPAIAQKFTPIIQAALDRHKSRQGVYTYDDMLLLVRDSICSAQGTWLVQALRKRYRFALIDEFQDTDEIQWDIFREVFYNAEDLNRMFVIGDPKQAIYAFRGADVYTYINACERMLRNATPERPCVMLRLEENFRSTPQLIDAYNKILDQEATPPFFSGESIRYDHPVRCGNPDQVTLDAHGAPIAPIVLGIMRRRDERTPVRTDDLYQCYGRWIALEIRRILSDDFYIQIGPSASARRVRPSDIFILTRTHSDETRLEKHLQELGVPYVFYKQDGLFQTPEAAEILTLLAAIASPHDRARRLKAWETPFFGVGLEELMHCRDLDEAHPLYRALLDWHQLARAQRFEELFTDIVQSSGIIKRELFFKDSERELTNYLHILEVLLEEAHLARLDLGELVSRTRAFVEGRRKPLAEEGNVKRLEGEAEGVQIMTMHKSKGLEAPVVFLYAFGGMASDFWPFHYNKPNGDLVRALHILKPDAKLSPRLNARAEAEAREEDERLLYVAITRARGRLYLPFVPYIGSQPACKALASRSYHALNRRLRAIVEEVEGAQDAPDKLFELQEIPYFGPGAGPLADEPPDWRPLMQWRPRSRLLEQRDRSAEFRWLRGKSLRLESYSSLKRREGGYQLMPAGEEDLRVEEELGTSEDAVGPQELPGGVRTGQFLHDVLERLDYSTLTRHRDFSDWSDDADVHALFVRSMQEHGLEPRYLPLSKRIIHRALNSTVPVGSTVIYGVGLCVPNMREVEFLYPMPDRPFAALAPWPDDPPEIERGFIKGYIDYVFEHRKRVYFVDWKSDILERYDITSLASHFEHNYLTQSLLYTVALCRMLDIHDQAAYDLRFGGAIYGFLRGMSEEGDHGIHLHRPAWPEVVAFAQALAQPDMGAHLTLTSGYTAVEPPSQLSLEDGDWLRWMGEDDEADMTPSPLIE